MDNSSPLSLKQGVQALVTTFDSMKEMSIDSSFSDAEQVFARADNTTWLREGLWGFPDCRMSNLASIQSKALNTINSLTAAIEQSRSKTEVDSLHPLLQNLIHAYQEGSLKGLEKLITFRGEAAAWHSSHKLEKLSASIIGFRQTIENALKLTHFCLRVKSNEFEEGKSTHSRFHCEQLTFTPSSPSVLSQEPMKRGSPPPPPTAAMKAPVFTPLRISAISKGAQEWSSLVQELKDAIAVPRLKPIGERSMSKAPTTEEGSKLWETLNRMRRDLSNSGLPETNNWEGD